MMVQLQAGSKGKHSPSKRHVDTQSGSCGPNVEQAATTGGPHRGGQLRVHEVALTEHDRGAFRVLSAAAITRATCASARE